MDEPEAEGKGAKKRDRGYAAVALRELRRARRAMDQAPNAETVPALSLIHI